MQGVEEVGSNLAGGAARFSRKEFIQFVGMARGALSELETQLIIAKKVGYHVDGLLMDEVEVLRRKTLNCPRYLRLGNCRYGVTKNEDKPKEFCRSSSLPPQRGENE
ncbi:MAG TPA: four helix bundle protein [Atribacteraceae bacterium]|nr:four helix bundle protein [Atribacteraceae bacterium]